MQHIKNPTLEKLNAIASAIKEKTIILQLPYDIPLLSKNEFEQLKEIGFCKLACLSFHPEIKEEEN